MSRRAGLALTLAAAAAAVLWSAPLAAGAAVNLGRIAPMGPTGGCGGCTFFQSSSDPASNSYRVPPGGPWTVTSWSVRGGSMADSARLRILRPTGVAGQYQLVAESADVDVAPVAAPMTPVVIPVQPGDVIGLRTLGATDLPGVHPSGFAADGASSVIGGPFLIGQTTGPGGTFPYATSASNFVNVAATLTSPDPVAPPPETGKPPRKCKKPKGKKKAKPKAAAAKKKRKQCRRKKPK